MYKCAVLSHYNFILLKPYRCLPYVRHMEGSTRSPSWNILHVKACTSSTTCVMLWVDGFAEAFATHHASQCGYCTPGFVVATHAALRRCFDQGSPATIDALQQGLDGNLCRCTGYRPILDACRVCPFLHSADSAEWVHLCLIESTSTPLTALKLCRCK